MTDLDKAAANRGSRPRYTDAGRVEALVDRLEPRLQRAFREALARMRDRLDLGELADMLSRGQIEDALDVVTEAAVRTLTGANAQAIIAAADDAAKFLSQALRLEVVFDQVNQRAVEAIRRNSLQFIRDFTSEQRRATRLALQDGISRGLNPRDQARLFRDSIGLTQKQEASVQNYRRLLQENSTEALTRELRDRRYDASVRRAAQGEGLTPDQIERMVDRYRQRSINLRAETIARTEALRSAHEGSNLMYEEAIAEGRMVPEQLVQSWSCRRDGRERAWHRSMADQVRPFGQPFISGRGNRLMYPGDPSAPGVEVISCRCSIVTRYVPRDQVPGAQR